MEWAIGIIIVVLVLYALGRAKGAPDPATQSDAWLHLRLQTESAWISKYLRSSLANQRSESLKKMHDEKVQYIKSIDAELMSRRLGQGVGAVSKELQPVLVKATELQKTGMSQAEALQEALEAELPGSKLQSKVPPPSVEEALLQLNELLAAGTQLPIALQRIFPAMQMGEAHGINTEVIRKKLNGMPKDEALRGVLGKYIATLKSYS
jgi:hypothetical protein